MARASVELAGKRVTVMGLGSFGGGAGAVRFLVGRGAEVTVTDLRTEQQLAATLQDLGDAAPARLHLGGHVPEDFTDADLVVVSPAVPKENPFLRLATEHGVALTSEMNLFWERNPGRVIGVTGSNGKSTTTALTHTLLTASGQRAWLGGNIGRSLLPHVDEIQPDDWVVLELSSFQLEDLAALERGPEIAVVTNFTPNHLDRHGTLAAYRAAKQGLLRWQTPVQWAVLNADDPDVAQWPTSARRLEFGLADTGHEGLFAINGHARFRLNGREHEFPVQRALALPGRHNLQNALAAACAALAAGVTPDVIPHGLSSYQPLPHRLELVGEVAGRRFYNDSLATTPESTQVALAAFAEPILLLAGGYDKGSDLDDMARAIASSSVKGVALLGQTGPTLGERIARHDSAGKVRRQVCQNFAEAFGWSVANSAAGDVVLLSPGCASYDWFRNFADRGDQFRSLVRNWPGQ